MVRELRKDPYKPLTSKLRPVCRVGPGTRSTGNNSRDMKGAGSSEDMLRGPL